MANKLIHIFLELVGEQIMNYTYFVHLKFWIKLYATGKNYGMVDCITKYGRYEVLFWRTKYM